MPGICPMCDRPTNGPCECEEILRVPPKTWDDPTLSSTTPGAFLREARESGIVVCHTCGGPNGCPSEEARRAIRAEVVAEVVKALRTATGNWLWNSDRKHYADFIEREFGTAS